MKTEDKPIIVEQTFRVSTVDAWEAITSINKMKEWYFNNIPDFKAEIGFKTKFNVNSNVRSFMHRWEVTEVVNYKKIKYNWTFDNYRGKSSSCFEIFQQNNLTKLKLTIEILEDFEENIEEFTTESCNAGWNYFIKNRLKLFLEENE